MVEREAGTTQDHELYYIHVHPTYDLHAIPAFRQPPGLMHTAELFQARLLCCGQHVYTSMRASLSPIAKVCPSNRKLRVHFPTYFDRSFEDTQVQCQSTWRGSSCHPTSAHLMRNYLEAEVPNLYSRRDSSRDLEILRVVWRHVKH